MPCASSPSPDGSPTRRVASLCICPSVGPGKTSSVALWHDCAPCHSLLDGALSATDPQSGQLNVPANSHQLALRGAFLAYRRRIPPTMAAACRHHRVCVAISRRPHPHLLDRAPGSFAFPYPSALVLTPPPIPSVDSGLVSNPRVPLGLVGGSVIAEAISLLGSGSSIRRKCSNIWRTPSSRFGCFRWRTSSPPEHLRSCYPSLPIVAEPAVPPTTFVPQLTHHLQWRISKR